MDQETVIESCKGLVFQIAKKFKNRGAEWDDLVQAGILGILEAYERFDLKYDVKFSTFAYYHIVKQMQVAVQGLALVKLPGSIWEIIYKVKKAEAQYHAYFGEAPDEAELSAMADLTEAHINKAQYSYKSCAYNDNFYAGENKDLLIYFDVQRGLDKLTPKEKSLISLRLIGYTHKECGQALGYTAANSLIIEQGVVSKLQRTCCKE